MVKILYFRSSVLLRSADEIHLHLWMDRWQELPSPHQYEPEAEAVPEFRVLLPSDSIPESKQAVLLRWSPPVIHKILIQFRYMHMHFSYCVHIRWMPDLRQPE